MDEGVLSRGMNVAGDRTAGPGGQDSTDFILSAEGSHWKVSDNGVT